MGKTVLNFFTGTLLLCMAGLSSASSDVTNFPNQPVSLIVPYPPGGVTDTQARFVAQKLSELWDESVIVENKPGGNTIIATSYMLNASSKPGYKLLISSMPKIGRAL